MEYNIAGGATNIIDCFCGEGKRLKMIDEKIAYKKLMVEPGGA